MKHIPGAEGMRGIACLIVVILHNTGYTKVTTNEGKHKKHRTFPLHQKYNEDEVTIMKKSNKLKITYYVLLAVTIILNILFNIARILQYSSP